MRYDHDNEIVIDVARISKSFHVYSRPVDRLIEFLTKRKRHTVIRSLNDLSFQVPRGSTMGIIGRNGAGKSTLLQIIAGTLKPSSGTAKVNGRVAALLELGAGFNPDFTGRENVFLYGAILGLSHDEIESRYNDIVAFADIGDFISYPVKTYSSGMFVRLAFSVAINVDPDILIVDEALSVGDIPFQHKCMAKLKSLQSNGCTILFVSHDIDSVKSLCDSAILLDRGHIVSSGSASEVSKEYLTLIHSEQLARNRESRDLVKPDFDGSPEDNWDRDSFSGADRHGNGQAKFVAVRFENSRSGRVTDRCEFGDKLGVELFVEYVDTVSTEINVGVMFRDDKGVDIYGDDSWNHQILLPAGEAGSRFEITFLIDIYLKPGSYALVIALGAVEADRLTWNVFYYDWIERAKILTVTTGDKRVWSKVLLPTQVDVIARD